MSTKFQPKSIWASTPFTNRGSHVNLGGDPKGKNFLYVNGNNVFIRDIENPSIVDVFAQHSYPTTCAKYSPSGFYIASGDNHGNLKIWDTVNPEHLVKYEYVPISGPIKDIAWTEDSKRIVLVGQGMQKHGAAIIVDTGTSVGNIDLNKQANSCDVRQTRPYRAITGSDDYRVHFFEGPPFKYKCRLSKHTNWVLCTRFSPDGTLFSSSGSDGQCFLYDGKTSDFKLGLGGEGNKAHKGSIFGNAWRSDSKQLLTVSGDKTVKIWDVESNSVVTEFVMGTEVEDQQVGCLWQNNHILTLSVSGNINYLDPNDPSKPYRIVKGHQKAIKGLTVNADKSKLYSGSFDGATNSWDVGTGCAESQDGNKPKHLSAMDFSEDKISTVGVDDTLRVIDVTKNEYMEGTCSLDSQPRDVARGVGNVSVVAGIEKLTVVRDTNKASVLDVAFNPTAVTIHPNQSEVAVGAENGELHIFTLSADKLTEKKSISKAISESVTRVSYSPDGEHLAVASTSKEIEVFKVHSDYEPMKRTLYKQNGKVTDVAWSPDNRHYASTSLDGSVYIWTLDREQNLLHQPGVHGRNEATCVQWLDEKTIATAGGDCCIRVSEIKL